MKTQGIKAWRNTLLAVGMTLLLLSCGGGGGSATLQTPVVTAEVATGVESLPVGVLTAPTTTVVTGADGGLVLTAESASLQGLAQGEVVFLAASPDQGLPVPFVGKVVSTVTAAGLTEIKLSPANVEDAYTSLQWDIDTALTGAAVVGVIAPKNASVSFSSRPAPVNQAGLVLTDSLTLDGNTLSGTIKLEHEIEDQGKKIVLFAEVDLSKVSVRSKGSYDVKNIASAGGWAEFTAVVKGDIGAKIGLRTQDAVDISNLSNLLGSQKIWDKLKWTGSDQFTLEGLTGGDKKGRFPLGGVVLTPCPTGVCPVTFTGNLSNAAIRGFSLAPTVVLWVYVDMNGKVSVEGETGARLRGYHFEQGYEFKVVKANLEAKRIDVATPQAIELYGSGKLDVTQRLGVSVAADILVGGIRPAAVNAFVGGKYEGKLEGDLSYAIVPANGWSGYGCIASKVWAGIQLDANFRIKAEFSADLGFVEYEFSRVIERAITGQPLAFFEQDLGSACYASGPFALNAAVRGADPANANNYLVDIDFSAAYNNANVRPLTDKWLLRAECANCAPLEFDIPSSKAGRDVISLPAGHLYTLILRAVKNNGLIIKEAVGTLDLGDQPLADFAVTSNTCANLTLTATATAATGRTITTYAWTVRRTGGATQTYTGNPAAAVLPSCGETAITLSVTDSAGFVTVVSRTLDTTALTPSIASILPASATLNQSTTFSVSGQSLPLTAVMTLVDATCATPTNRTATGFTVQCTPTATGGKTATIKTDTAGTVIDNSRSITVTLAISTARLPDTGITANQCYAAGSDALVSCTSAAAIALNDQQDGMLSVNPMSYSSVGSYALTECVKDNVTGLIWEGKTASGTRSGSNTYTNWGDGRAGDASAYATTVNGMALCGHTDWRLPTAEELQSLVDYGVAYPGPTIDANFFPNTLGWPFWTSSPYAGSSDFAWCVVFNDGFVRQLPQRRQRGSVGSRQSVIGFWK